MKDQNAVQQAEARENDTLYSTWQWIAVCILTVLAGSICVYTGQLKANLGSDMQYVGGKLKWAPRPNLPDAHRASVTAETRRFVWWNTATTVSGIVLVAQVGTMAVSQLWSRSRAVICGGED